MQSLEVQPIPYRYSSSEYVTTPPVFDIERAWYARDDAMELVKAKTDRMHLSALELSIALSLYNHTVRSEKVAEENPQLGRQIDQLIHHEVTTGNVSNPLPTIGIEVESPLKPYLL